MAGDMHLLIDFWGASHLDDIAYIENALRQAAFACCASVVSVHLGCDSNKGVNGVVILAESHISIHTRPRIDYVALDVFMCANSDPYLAVPVLYRLFKPGEMKVTEASRGIVMSSELISE